MVILSTTLRINSTSKDIADQGADDIAATRFVSLHKPLTSLCAHAGPVSSLALAGEFILTASLSGEIFVWQQPNLRPFSHFGHGDGAVKSLVASSNRVFTAHQDRRIRVWEISRRQDNAFRLIATLPTTKDYLLNLIHGRGRNFIQNRRNHQRLWIEHYDTISCLAVCNGLVYSGSWDKTIKVWTAADLRCLESIKAHDDAINGIVAHNGMVCSASADGKVRIWEKGKTLHSLKATLVSRKAVSWNAVILCDGGRLVYGGGSDGSVMGWETQAARMVCNLRAHEMAVLCVCSASEFVCTGSADKSIGVWKREGGGGLERISIIRGHEGPVKCLQASWEFGDEGFKLYSGGVDKYLRVWWVPKKYGEAN